MKLHTALLGLLVIVQAVVPNAVAQEGDNGELAEITVTGSRVANDRPAGTYATVATELRFDPATELQSRGLAEGQADVTVRGGLFENTGFMAGAVTIMDPQTGHYVAGLPIDPGLLEAPRLLTGIDNALAGFNSSIATVEYAFREIDDAGEIGLGTGSDGLAFMSLRLSESSTTTSGNATGYAMSFASSEGDGTIDNGDHEFSRFNVHVQNSDSRQQTDVLLSYQDKFYGWPGAYTGFATLPETDRTKTTLVLGNHRIEQADGFFEIGAFYRRLEDDYDFDRRTNESGAPGSFDHETRVIGAGIRGAFSGGTLDWHYAGQIMSDELVFSTDLTAGNFRSRDYATASLVPTWTRIADDGRGVVLRFGATADWSNRDGGSVSPMLGATLRFPGGVAVSQLSLEYAETAQLPGYTALNSPPTGLFGGNADLERETARQLSLTAARDAGPGAWDGRVTVFYRQDDDLVDWTYASGAPFSRQANAVDIDVFGLELFVRAQWEPLDLVGSYTYLDKDADYGTAMVDASFYALNFATHRATFALRYRFPANLELRWDNEYRRQRDNPLRAGSDDAYIASVAVAMETDGGLGLALTADNLTDDDFQQFPGTPAVGRHLSLRASYQW
jgi:vitamin B12 transporter